MKHFVQLKDGIVFAFHSSSVDEIPSGNNIVEVDSDGEKHLNKKYENGEFIDAPLIKYAILDESNNNTVVGIETTVFASNVKGPVITNDEVKVLWTWNGSSFVSPAVVEPVQVILAENAVEPYTAPTPQWTEEQLAAYEASKNN